jgi:hypothetical protein
METLGSAKCLVIGQVVLQSEVIARLTSSAATSQDPVTVLADLHSLPLEMQNILRSVLTASLSRVWVLFTAAAGLYLLVGFLIRHKTVLR